MKIVKVLFVFALVSMIAVSCKETKKEEVQDDDAVEMTETESTIEWVEEESSEPESEATESDAEEAGAAAATGAAATKAVEPAVEEEESEEVVQEAVEAEASEVEELVIPAGVIAEELAETPVVYPGCAGSVEEIRACNRENFIAFLKDEFDRSLAESFNLEPGNHEIKSIIQVDKSGKLSALRIYAPNKVLEAEMLRVIGEVPMVVPATKGGEPVLVTFILPIKFKVTH